MDPPNGRRLSVLCGAHHRCLLRRGQMLSDVPEEVLAAAPSAAELDDWAHSQWEVRVRASCMIAVGARPGGRCAVAPALRPHAPPARPSARCLPVLALLPPWPYSNAAGDAAGD